MAHASCTAFVKQLSPVPPVGCTSPRVFVQEERGGFWVFGVEFMKHITASINKGRRQRAIDQWAQEDDDRLSPQEWCAEVRGILAKPFDPSETELIAPDKWRGTLIEAATTLYAAIEAYDRAAVREGHDGTKDFWARQGEGYEIDALVREAVEHDRD